MSCRRKPNERNEEEGEKGFKGATNSNCPRKLNYLLTFDFLRQHANEPTW